MTESAPTNGAQKTPLFGPLLAVLIIVGLVAALLWQSGVFARTPNFVLITGSTDPYWDAVIEGAQAAARHYRVNLRVVRPTRREAEQIEVLRGLLAGGADGVAVSVADPVAEKQIIGEVAARLPLVTMDSDAPDSKRIAFVGADNYAAGRVCGELVKEALPQGGRVVIAIGSLDQLNGQQRRQGLIDELLDRPYQPGGSPEPADAVLAGPKYQVVATRIDGVNRDKAKELALQALTGDLKPDCIVGLYSYNVPQILLAAQEAGRLGHVKVVGFDAAPETLAGVESGSVFGTVAQDQFSHGFEAIRILDVAVRGDMTTGMPISAVLHIPTYTITAGTLSQYKADMQRNHQGVPPR